MKPTKLSLIPSIQTLTASLPTSLQGQQVKTQTEDQFMDSAVANDHVQRVTPGNWQHPQN